MQRLNRKIEYALIALKYMSGKFAGQLTTVKEITQAARIPFDATSRVMQQMAQRQILKSEHGSQGGYMLIRDLNKVPFLEIFEMIEGPVEVVRCVANAESCEVADICKLAAPIKVFNARLSAFYSSFSVAEIINAKELDKENVVESTKSVPEANV